MLLKERNTKTDTMTKLEQTNKGRIHKIEKSEFLESLKGKPLGSDRLELIKKRLKGVKLPDDLKTEKDIENGREYILN